MLRTYFVMKWRKLLLAAVCLTAIVTAIPAQAVLATPLNVQQELEARTKEDIVKRWNDYKPMSTGNSYMSLDQVYIEQPNLSPPYAAGKLKREFLQDGLNATNFVRYLAGLPDDVELDWTLELQQQTGALVNAVNDRITHHPKQPSGMSDAMYQLGYAAASSSNLYWGSPTFYDNVLGYMADSDSSNIDRVGHRRWILNPSMKKTMFGMAAGDSAFKHATMYALNNDRPKEEVSFDYISWPSAGHFPSEVFAPNDAWSVSLNPARYDRNRTNDISVTLVRTKDGQKWEFSSNDTDSSGKYFNVETNGYGVPFAVIFRPDKLGAFKNNDTYEVHIKGLYTTAGSQTSIQFTTAFIHLLGDFAALNMIYMESGETINPLIATGSSVEKHTITSSDSRVVAVNSDGSITAGSAGYATITIDEYLGNQDSIFVNVTPRNKSNPVSMWAKDDIKRIKEAGLQYEWYNQYYQKPITRDDFVKQAVNMIQTVIGHSLYEQNDVYGKSPFKDANDWMITWANSNRIISGTGPNKFSPGDAISREQAAKLLLNVHKYLASVTGKEMPASAASPSKFADDSQIAAWAKTDVYQAAGLSLMNGAENNRFNPKGSLTYEQTLVILLRMFKQFYDS